MPKTLSAADTWWSDSGYEFHCFISWASTEDRAIIEVADQLKKDIESRLRSYGYGQCKVFLDSEGIRGGARWRKVISGSICRSIVMVCLCTPDYYTQTHKWCGLEFAAMRKLEGVRIPKDADFGSIIPVTIVRDPSVPPVMSGMKPIDFSGLMRVGRPTFCDGPEYNEALMFIVDRIIQVAEFLRKNDKVAGCDKFDLPKRSAFANRYRRKEKFPRFR